MQSMASYCEYSCYNKAVLWPTQLKDPLKTKEAAGFPIYIVYAGAS